MNQESPGLQKPCETTFALIAKDLGYIRDKVDEIDENVKCNYVLKHEFMPVKNIVYGLVSIILSGVIIGILALVIK